MTAQVLETLQNTFAEPVGWALVHTLWQGALVALLAAVLLRVARRSANARYLICGGGLTLLSVAPVMTALLLWPSTATMPTVTTTEAPTAPLTAVEIADPVTTTDAAPAATTSAAPEAARSETSAAAIALAPLATAIQPWLPWLVLLWLTGVGVMSARTLLAWTLVQRWRSRYVEPLSRQWDAVVTELRQRLGVPDSVRILISHMADIPTTIGWLRPVVLLPASVMTGLTPDQLRAVIAHELAHVRRWDYLVNLLQVVVETLLFYHPAVWWLSRQMRVEREHCCDDMAVEACGCRHTYARALVEVAAMGQPVHIAPSAAGGRLTTRIRRVLGLSELQRDRRADWLAGAATLLVAAALLLPLAPHATTPAEAAEETPDPNAAFVMTLHVVADDTGEPLAGAEVRVGGNCSSGPEIMFTNENGVLSLPFESEVVYDASFTASAPGRTPQTAWWNKRHWGHPVPDEYTLRLPRGATVGGRVVDLAGEPVAGAEVQVKTPGVSVDAGHYTGPQTAYLKLTTDADGRWQCDQAPQRIASLEPWVRHDDYVTHSETMPAGSTPFKALYAGKLLTKLDPGLVVRGVVRGPDGRAVEGAHLRMGAHIGYGNSIERSTTTGPDGRYELTKVTPGDNVLLVEADGYAPSYTRERIKDQASGPVTLDVRLPESQTVTLRVVDPTGAPISETRVYLRSWDNASIWGFGPRGQTDQDGRLTFEHVPPVEHGFDFSAAGYRYQMGRKVALNRENVITMYPELTISGQVVDAETERPLEQFKLVPGWTGWGGVHWDDTHTRECRDGEYAYTFAHDYPGEYLVRIEAEGYEPVESPLTDPNAGGAVYNFALTRASEPQVTVVDQYGDRAEGAEVALADGTNPANLSKLNVRNGYFRDLEGLRTRHTDGNGQVALPGGRENWHVVVLHDKGYFSGALDEVVADGRITLTSWGSIEGLHLVGDQPGANREMTLRPLIDQAEWPMWRYETRTTEDGDFRFERVKPGRYVIAHTFSYLQIGGRAYTGNAASAEIEVVAGREVGALVGGTGRPVVGRVTPPETAGPDAWQYVVGRLEATTARYRALGRTVLVNEDAVFRADDVPPGEYELKFVLRDPNDPFGPAKLAEAETTVTVPALPAGERRGDAVDVGEIELLPTDATVRRPKTWYHDMVTARRTIMPLGISLFVPETWTETLDVEPQTRKVTFRQPEAEMKPGSKQQQISISMTENGGPTSIDTTSPPGDTVRAHQIFEVDGQPARLTAYFLPRASGESPSGTMVHVQFAKDTRSYLMTMIFNETDPYEYISFVEQTCGTIKLLPMPMAAQD